MSEMMSAVSRKDFNVCYHGNVDDIEQLFNIKVGGELREILGYCKVDQPTFFDTDKRLLSIEEILNYKDELKLESDNVIPLIDLYDNDFLGFDVSVGQFVKFYAVDGHIWERLDTIKNYLDLLKSYLTKAPSKA